MAAQNTFQRIHKLPDYLVNQISAGEVIERPASVVKELLENSIDAGATDILVEIRGGGSRLIRVNDNGHGIHNEDLTLAIDSHSTSKLDSKSNLHKILTLGFRGEALSSIASVSRFTLVSRQQNSDHGWSINSELSRIPEPAAHPVGTTVEVRNLFFNTPARRKFLRSEKTETIHIQELVKRISLSRFNLAMKLLLDGREALLLSDDSKNPEHRVTVILGRKFIQNSVVIEQQLDDMYLHGWAGTPDIARSQTDQQLVYLNGRIIKDKLINHAIRMAYDEYLYSGRYPAYLLYLQMDHEAADINVHPTKHEVRFRDARKVHDFIYSCVSRFIQEKKSKVSLPSNHVIELNTETETNKTYCIKEETGSFVPAINHGYINEEKYSYGIPVAQIKGQYLFTEVSSGVLLHDIYRMREIISKSRLEDTLESGEIYSRPVLVPIILPVNDKIQDILENYSETFLKIGLEFRQVSHDKIQIRELPSILPYADPPALAKDIIDFIDHEKFSEDTINKLFDILSIHANDLPPLNINVREMNALLSEYYSLKSRIAENLFQSAIRSVDMKMLKEIINGKY